MKERLMRIIPAVICVAVGTHLALKLIITAIAQDRVSVVMIVMITLVHWIFLGLAWLLFEDRI